MVAFSAMLSSGCKKNEPPVADRSAPESKLSGVEKSVSDLVASEDLLLDLSPRLSKLAKWLETTSGHPFDGPLHSEFQTCSQVKSLDVISAATLFEATPNYPSFVEIADWPIQNALATVPIHPWQALQSLNVQLETLKFGVLSAKFTNVEQTEFLVKTKIEGRGFRGQEVFGLKGYQDLVFRSEANDWILDRWFQEGLKMKRSPQALFREVLTEVLPDKDSLSHSQRSHKDEIIVKSARTGKQEIPIRSLAKWTELPSTHLFPSVSVVDFDSDGDDDLFLTSRWGPSQMLQNQGDGTFKEVAKEIGLFQENLVNCILFVDLDNDGDKDAIMGRPMKTAIYYRNDGGQFVDVTNELSDLGEQYFISAVSASDVNRDGLIDLYLSSYPPLGKDQAQFEDHFLSDEERFRFSGKKYKANVWLNQVGSSNVLLMNRGGGKLERVPFDEVLSQWRRSHQSVWADVDDDGDDDLYICNDFAPDALLRNDTPIGSGTPVFVDVTQTNLKPDVLGFGMGGSFGDFDADGDLDLYVSNMFSKAGRRIIGQLENVDPRIASTAAGSFLWVNEDGNFEQQAGSEAKQFPVNQIGWSYGGQWADFNNDARLDLYVPTGFYTAPKELTTLVDN